MRYIYNGKPLYHSVEGLQHLEPAPEQVDLDKHKYGLPKLKKYPMPDAAHVKSAIKFFNYVSPKDEKTLANAILNRMREYGITDVNVGEDNRFSKYYHPDTLQHSSGEWINKKYERKIEMPDGSFRYIYPGQDASIVGSRLNAPQGGGVLGDRMAPDMTGKNSNMHSNNQGISNHPKTEAEFHKNLQNFMEQSAENITGRNAPKNNQGVVGGTKKEDSTKDSTDKKTTATTTDTKKTGKKGKGGSGKKGSGSKKSGSSKSGSGKVSPGKASGGKSGKSGSGKSGSSGKSSDADSKKAAKEAKKQQKAQKDYQKELQKMKEENKRKQDELFKKRKQENEKRWKAEEERMELMRDTSRQSVSKETLSDIIEMLKGSDKEYAKKLLEGGRSKIDDYLDWLKESRKNNSK